MYGMLRAMSGERNERKKVMGVGWENEGSTIQGDEWKGETSSALIPLLYTVAQE